jgi:hypothetical protein
MSGPVAGPTADRASRSIDRPWPSGAFALIVVAAVLAIIDIVAVPVLLQEGATDWRAYEGGAQALAAGVSPYAWVANDDIRALTQYPYIYPPPLAAIWGLGLTATIFLGLKVASTTALGAFAISSTKAVGPIRVAASAAIVALGVASPPVVHDLVLGNVMTLYLAAVAIALALPGSRLAAIPLGILCAIALKPAALPIILWMLVRNRSQFVAALVAGATTTVLFAALLGPGVYIDYLRAVPRLGGLAQPFSGNVGLSSISIGLALAAIPVALAACVWAARVLDLRAGAVVAVAMTQFAQPAIGLNYASLLIPGVVLLWFVSRKAAFVMGISLPLVTLISPPVAGLLLAGSAVVGGWRQRVAAGRDTRWPAVSRT